MREAELSMMRRLGASEEACSPLRPILRARMERLDGLKRPCGCERDVYSGRLKLNGEEHEQTLLAANNYATSLGDLKALRRSQVAAAQNDARGATRSRRES